MTKGILLTIYFLAFCSPSHAQTPNRSNPPAPGKPKNLQLQSIQRFKLSNGLNVMLMEKHNVPLVQVNLLVQSGLFDDPMDKSGLCSLTLDLIDESAGTLNALELSDEIEFLGTNISTYAGSFSCGIDCTTQTSKLDPSLKLMSDIALKPRFEVNDIERVRRQQLNTVLQNHDEPWTIASHTFKKYVFAADTPYGKFPDEKSINSISRENLISFHKQHFTATNSILIVVGDVTKQAISPLLEKYFASYPAPVIENYHIKPAPRLIKGRTLYLVNKPDAAQSIIYMGRIGASHSSLDYFNLVVMNTILGGSFTSRLNTNLREQHGYSYGAESSFKFWPVNGPFICSAAVQTESTAEALNEFFNEFKKMRKPIPESDIIHSKNYNALGYAKKFETNEDLADALAELVIYHLPDSYFNTYVEQVLSVNKKAVETVAKKYITPDDMLIVVVGDRAKIEGSIKKLKLGDITFLTIEDVLGKKPQP